MGLTTGAMFQVKFQKAKFYKEYLEGLFSHADRRVAGVRLLIAVNFHPTRPTKEAEKLGAKINHARFPGVDFVSPLMFASVLFLQSCFFFCLCVIATEYAPLDVDGEQFVRPLMADGSSEAACNIGSGIGTQTEGRVQVNLRWSGGNFLMCYFMSGSDTWQFLDKKFLAMPKPPLTWGHAFSDNFYKVHHNFSSSKIFYFLCKTIGSHLVGGLERCRKV